MTLLNIILGDFRILDLQLVTQREIARLKRLCWLVEFRNMFGGSEFGDTFWMRET